MRKFVLLCTVLCANAAGAQALEVWLRAFIPNPANAGAGAGFVVPMPDGGMGSLVRVLNRDGAINSCFVTDNRGFSDSAGSSARLETRFTISIDAGTCSAASPPRTVAGTTVKVDCESGVELERKLGSVDRDHIGACAFADGQAQVSGQAQGKNLLAPAAIVAPSIDYSWDLLWTPETGAVEAKLSFGSFPAFEVYAREPGGAWVPLERKLPSGTPWTLGGDSFGINLIHTESTVTVPGNLVGRWESEPGGEQARFWLEFMATSANWTERSATGSTLVREVPIEHLPDGSLRLSRPNDSAALDFLSFQPSLKQQVLARSPRASFLQLKREGASLRGTWNGLLVIKDQNARLKELVQPGEPRTTKPVTFRRAPSP